VLQASVIVPARNAAFTLPRTLEALARQELDGKFEVIVVDDGSTDGTAALARRAPGPISVLQQPASGPAIARNRGVERSTASVLAFCDADVAPAPGWLRAGVKALQRADVVQGKVLPDPAARIGPFDRSLWVTGHLLLWETANLFVTRELFDRVGGFEDWITPRFGKAIAEDVWFGYRALRLGAHPAFCDQALAHHAVFKRTWRSYLAERRRLVYFPAMAAKMPELREDFLYRRVFLNRRSARFDLGLAGVLAALGLRSPLPLIVTLPYLRALVTHGQRALPAESGSGAGVACIDLAGDLVGLLALATGSLRYRSLVL
jgi:glycosyltransferase involved in cell wall biosynthesis